MKKIILGGIYGMRNSLDRMKFKRDSSMSNDKPQKFIKGGLNSLRKNRFKKFSFLMESDSDSDIIIE